MDPKIFIIIAISFAYAFFEVLINLRQQRTSKVISSRDQGSLRLLYGLITVAYMLAYAVAATKLGRIYAWNSLFATGMVLFVIGLVIRTLAILTLKQAFTYSVATVEGQKIVQTGLYKWIRHPGYLGQLIIFLGIAISLSNWLSIIVMMIPILPGYLYRIQIEEKFMLEQIGQDYRSYQARTKRLIPMIY
jgi:protein-S-isoprenylcysteine O-methyltransferase